MQTTHWALLKLILIIIIFVIGGYYIMDNINNNKFINKISESKNNIIYLAGGCFWGVEAYFSKLPGVLRTTSGYANGKIENPTYKEVSTGETGFVETVEIEYDKNIISLEEILDHYFDIVDPTTLNRQAHDIGTQYRSGIYYKNDEDKIIIEKTLKEEQKKYKEKIVTEAEKLTNFYKAEEYHQKYLDKNPGGYCHIDLSKANKYQKYKKSTKSELKQKLTDIQYKVTQEAETEKPFTSEYEKNFEDGIYVDIATGEPLFSSKDKYDAGCGWPSFSKPIDKSALKEKKDVSYGMIRTEVKSKIGNSHLGHLFDDGPKDLGGHRYCINGAALKFIPVKNLKKEGYEEYLYLFK